VAVANVLLVEGVGRRVGVERLGLPERPEREPLSCVRFVSYESAARNPMALPGSSRRGATPRDRRPRVRLALERARGTFDRLGDDALGARARAALLDVGLRRERRDGALEAQPQMS